MPGETRRCPCGVDWEGGNFDCPATVNSPDGFASGGDAGVTGTVELKKPGTGNHKVTLTIKGGIVTGIEEE